MKRIRNPHKDRLQNYLIFCFQNTQSFKGFGKQFRSSNFVTIPNLNKGFTLLEVIVSLIIISLFSAVFLGFYETHVVGSTKPVQMMEQGLALESVMEKISADYVDLLNSNSTPLSTLETRINTSIYGDYTPATKFVTFDSSNHEESAPCTAGCTNLKVSITIGDQTITTLFTE